MSSTQIMYFLAVVKYKTFTLAAEELYISQSSLSKQIKALEQELGHTLFNREGKENTLTDAGKIFLEYSENFSKAHSHLLSNLNVLSQRSSKKALTLGVLPAVSEYNIHNDLALFQTLISSSSIYINLLEDMQEDLISLLHSGKIDSMIIRTDGLDMSDYEYVPILEEELVVIYSEKLTDLAQKEYVTIPDLVNYSLITFEVSSALHQITKQLFISQGMHPHFLYLYNKHEQILSMVNANFGISVMPANLVPVSDYPNIRIAHFPDHPTTTLSLVRLKDISPSKPLELLFEYFNSAHSS